MSTKLTIVMPAMKISELRKTFGVQVRSVMRKGRRKRIVKFIPTRDQKILEELLTQDFLVRQCEYNK